MTIKTTTGMTRRGLLGAFAATAVAAAPTYSNAAGFLRGGGDVRRLRMYSGRTGERMDTIYWIDGKYIGEAIREVNMFMRDWRTGEAIQMDTRTIDIMAAAHNLLDTSQPYLLLSGGTVKKTKRPTGRFFMDVFHLGFGNWRTLEDSNLWPLPSEHRK